LRQEHKALNHWRQLGQRYRRLEERQRRKRQKARRQKTSGIDTDGFSSEKITGLNDGLAAIGLEELVESTREENEMRKEPRRYLCYQGVPVSDKSNSSSINDDKQEYLRDDFDMISLSGPNYILTNFLIADAIDRKHIIAASGRVDGTGVLPGEALAWMLPEGDLVFRTELPVRLEDNNDVNHGNTLSELNRTAKRESLLEIGWQAKLMVTVEEEYRIGGRPIWRKIHIYDISGSHPRRLRSWTEDEQNGIRIYPRQVFVLPSWIDRKKHPELPNEIIIAGVDDSHKRTGIFIRISVDTPASTRFEFGDKPLNVVLFHPYFPDIILASTFEDEIIVWSTKTGKCLAKTKLPSTGFVPIVTSLVLGTAADLESMDDTKKYGCSDARGLRVIATTTIRNEKSNIYVFQLNLPHPDMYVQASKLDKTSDEMVGSLKLLTVHDIPWAYYMNNDVADRLLFTASIHDEFQSTFIHIYDLVTGECLFRSNKLGDWRIMTALSGTILVQSERDLFTIADTQESMEENNDEDDEGIDD
jgi:hypothetical protein